MTNQTNGTNGAVDSNAIRQRREALALMQAALAIIDQAGGLLDVGAHLDLAICKLEERLATPV